MKLILVNLYPIQTIARYLVSSYVLKAFVGKYYDGNERLDIDVLNFSTKAKVSDMSRKILTGKPDYIGYSCYVWNIEKINNLIGLINETRKIKHILGGPEISTEMSSSLHEPPAGDYYIPGEGERKLLNLMRYFGGSVKEIPDGVAYWDGTSIQFREDIDCLADLDDIPSIYLEGVIEERYYTKQQAFLETQRGCTNRCRYCVYRKFLSSVNYYSLPRVFTELDHLIIEKRVSALRIFDGIFTSDLERAKKIVSHILDIKKTGDIRLPWIFWEFTTYSVDEEFVRLTSLLKYRDGILNTQSLKPADHSQVYSEILADYTVINSVGIESFHTPTLKAVGRPGISKERFDAFMSLINKYNIVLKIDVILGLPMETIDSYFEGLESALPYFRHTDHILNIHRLQILPGSDLEKTSAEYGINYLREAPHLVFSTNHLPKDEFNHASQLTAVLFRTLNSPLRELFFNTFDRNEGSLRNFLEKLLVQIEFTEPLNNTRIVRDEFVTDDYWNDEIFSEIPSDWLITTLDHM